MDKILIGLPAFNEGPVIYDVIKKINDVGFNDVLVVDDCSCDNTFDESKRAGAVVLSHIVNRGAGAAPSSIIEYARANNYDYLVLMDSDGQHLPSDIEKLLAKSKKGIDLVIGSRLKGDIKNMPVTRRIANFIGSLFTLFFFGGFVWDSQSGFRVLNKKALSKINLTFDRFEFCSEMIGEAKRANLSIEEVPIKVVYTKHSLSKGHGQSISNGFKMIVKFLFK